jgi:hypothetical protein
MFVIILAINVSASEENLDNPLYDLRTKRAIEEESSSPDSYFVGMDSEEDDIYYGERSSNIDYNDQSAGDSGAVSIFGLTCSRWTCDTPTCDGGDTCGLTCDGWTCDSPTCDGGDTCGLTCDGWTCTDACPTVSGNTCNGAPTCEVTCGGFTCDSPTCDGGDTCGLTCGDGWTCTDACPTVGNTCNGALTCAFTCNGFTCDSPTCDGGDTCGLTCDGFTCDSPTCDGGDTCGLTCDGWICDGGSNCDYSQMNINNQFDVYLAKINAKATKQLQDYYSNLKSVQVVSSDGNILIR